MMQLLALLSAFITVFSVGLVSVSIRSYLNTNNSKLFFIAVVFLIFLFKGVLLSIYVFTPELLSHLTMPLFLGMDFIVLFLLFIGTLKP